MQRKHIVRGSNCILQEMMNLKPEINMKPANRDGKVNKVLWKYHQTWKRVKIQENEATWISIMKAYEKHLLSKWNQESIKTLCFRPVRDRILKGPNYIPHSDSFPSKEFTLPLTTQTSALCLMFFCAYLVCSEMCFSLVKGVCDPQFFMTTIPYTTQNNSKDDFA